MFVRKTKTHITILKSLIESIERRNNIWKDFISDKERKEIQRIIISVLNFFRKQLIKNELNQKQKVIMQLFEKVETSLQETNLISHQTDKVFSFWDFLGNEKIAENGNNQSCSLIIILCYIYF